MDYTIYMKFNTLIYTEMLSHGAQKNDKQHNTDQKPEEGAEAR